MHRSDDATPQGLQPFDVGEWKLSAAQEAWAPDFTTNRELNYGRGRRDGNDLERELNDGLSFNVFDRNERPENRAMSELRSGESGLDKANLELHQAIRALSNGDSFEARRYLMKSIRDIGSGVSDLQDGLRLNPDDSRQDRRGEKTVRGGIHEINDSKKDLTKALHLLFRGDEEGALKLIRQGKRELKNGREEVGEGVDAIENANNRHRRRHGGCEPKPRECEPKEPPNEKPLPGEPKPPRCGPKEPPIEEPKPPRCEPKEPPIEEPKPPRCEPKEPPIEEPKPPRCEPKEPPVEPPKPPKCEPKEPPVEPPKPPKCEPKEPPVEPPEPPKCEPKEPPVEPPKPPEPPVEPPKCQEPPVDKPEYHLIWGDPHIKDGQGNDIEDQIEANKNVLLFRTSDGASLTGHTASFDNPELAAQEGHDITVFDKEVVNLGDGQRVQFNADGTAYRVDSNGNQFNALADDETVASSQDANDKVTYDADTRSLTYNFVADDQSTVSGVLTANLDSRGYYINTECTETGTQAEGFIPALKADFGGEHVDSQTGEGAFDPDQQGSERTNEDFFVDSLYQQ